MLLTIAKDGPDDVVAEPLRDGPVLYLVVAEPTVGSVAAAAKPERAALVREDRADVGGVEAIGVIEELPVIAAPAGYAGGGLGEDAAAAVFCDGEDAGSAEASEGIRRYAAVNEVAASWEESAD